jgi:hypothetical protein
MPRWHLLMHSSAAPSKQQQLSNNTVLQLWGQPEQPATRWRRTQQQYKPHSSWNESLAASPRGRHTWV